MTQHEDHDEVKVVEVNDDHHGGGEDDDGEG
jgi:hypothetical protein